MEDKSVATVKEKRFDHEEYVSGLCSVAILFLWSIIFGALCYIAIKDAGSNYMALGLAIFVLVLMFFWVYYFPFWYSISIVIGKWRKSLE